MADVPRDGLPFVAAPPGSMDEVQHAARVAATTWGLERPELVRLSMTGVFVAGEDVVLRVCRPTAPPTSALALAQVLADHGLRVPRPVRTDAMEVAGLAVLAFERLHPTGDPIDWFEVGRMVADLHAIDRAMIPAEYPLPRGLDFPWWQLDGLLDELTAVLDEEASSAMRRCLTRHRPILAAARREPGVVCHGDVHPGNVIQTDGGPALLDWDSLCREPAGWDHAALRTWTSRWGGATGIYESFVAGSGEQLAGDPFSLATADLRLLAATLMRVRAARTDPSAATEAEQRLRWWRGDPAAPMWHAV